MNYNVLKNNISKDIIMRMAVLLTIITYIVTNYPKFRPFPNMTANLISWMLSIYLGRMPTIDNNIFFMKMHGYTYVFRTSVECSGLFIMLAFITVIFVTPRIRLKHRFYSIIFLPVLFILNSIRVTSGIIFADMTTMENLSIYHSTMGQILIFIFMTGLYAIFLKMFGYFHIDSDKNVA